MKENRDKQLIIDRSEKRCFLITGPRNIINTSSWRTRLIRLLLWDKSTSFVTNKYQNEIRLHRPSWITPGWLRLSPVPSAAMWGRHTGARILPTRRLLQQVFHLQLDHVDWILVQRRTNVEQRWTGLRLSPKCRLWIIGKRETFTWIENEKEMQILVYLQRVPTLAEAKIMARNNPSIFMWAIFGDHCLDK